MKKLHNERGETILMVLLLLVLATMVSAVVLAAAVSAAKNMHTDREAQQNYLTVSSAAELVRESILGKTYSRTETTIERTWLDEEGQEHSSTSTSVAYKRPDGLMAPWLNDCIDDDAEYPITAGMCHYCPEGHTHSIVNTGDTELKLLGVLPIVK